MISSSRDIARATVAAIAEEGSDSDCILLDSPSVQTPRHAAKPSPKFARTKRPNSLPLARNSVPKVPRKMDPPKTGLPKFPAKVTANHSAPKPLAEPVSPPTLSLAMPSTEPVEYYNYISPSPMGNTIPFKNLPKPFPTSLPGYWLTSDKPIL